MYDLEIGTIFYSRLLKKNFAVEIIPKEEQGWKSIRKWADIWRSAVYSRLGNKGLIVILAPPPSLLPMIAILTSDLHGSNFSYNSQVLRRKHPMLGTKLNPLSLLFQPVRYHGNNTSKRLQNNGFRTLQRNHMFSVALCIMHMRAWWLACVYCSYDPEPRVFFGFLWRQRS